MRFEKKNCYIGNFTLMRFIGEQENWARITFSTVCHLIKQWKQKLKYEHRKQDKIKEKTGWYGEVMDTKTKNEEDGCLCNNSLSHMQTISSVQLSITYSINYKSSRSKSVEGLEKSCFSYILLKLDIDIDFSICYT